MTDRDKIDALLEVVDALAAMVNKIAHHQSFYTIEAASIAARARKLYQENLSTGR